MTDASYRVHWRTDLPPPDAASGLQVSPLAEGASSRPDAVVYSADDEAGRRALLQRPDLLQSAFDLPVVVIAPLASPAERMALLDLGVQEVLEDAQPAALYRAIAHAVRRKQVEQSLRRAYSTDLATGLPHQTQLLEHMSQLIALREREPAPMVLIMLRIEGLAQAAGRLGDEAANILRRKLAVRLRSGLRASDVVAATGPETFGVLLGHIEAASDGETVVHKLMQVLAQPFQVAGRSCTVKVAAGIACFPEHGTDARELLHRATAQAATLAAMGGEGIASAFDRLAGAAANDDTGPV